MNITNGFHQNSIIAKKREMRHLSPKPLLDEDSLLDAFDLQQIPHQHAKRIWRNVIQKGMSDFQSIDQIPRRLVDLINGEFAVTTSKVAGRTDSSDGSTTKLLVELQDGLRVECVIMRYGYCQLDSYPEEERLKLPQDGNGVKFKSNKRATLCVSSQVGCSMGCTFCATGTMGLTGNLSAGEILEQLLHASQIEPIRNVVFMGMGEPLDNYDAVFKAVKGMTDTSRFALSPSRISISTVGVVPRLRALARDMPQVGLALSLHAPTQELRTRIVPSAKAWHIDRILEVTDAFIAQQNSRFDKTNTNRLRHVLVEYVIIKDINDSMEVAHQLGKLLQNRQVLLNVIPYNVTSVPFDYMPPDSETCRAFVHVVRNVYNVRTLFRQKLGDDIASACGQLVIDSQKPCSSTADMEDLGTPTKPSLPAARVSKRKSRKTIRDKWSPSSLEILLLGSIFTLSTYMILRKHIYS